MTNSRPQRWRWVRSIRDSPPNIEVDTRLTVDDILESPPYLAIGSHEEIAERIRAVRAKTGMSYVGVFPTQMEAFAPVIPPARWGGMRQ